MKNQGSCDKNGGGSSCDMKECWINLVKGALIGGFVMFLYLSVSWMVLPWHKSSVMSFKNSSAVASVLSSNAEKSGVYMLLQQQPAPKAKKGVKKVAEGITLSKPFAFVSVFKEGIDVKGLNRQLGWNLLLCMFYALLLTALLKKGTCCGGCPVLFSATVGLLVAVAGHLPGMIWYHFPLHHTLVGMVDDLLSFTLAGAVISKILLKTGACTMGSDKKGSCH